MKELRIIVAGGRDFDDLLLISDTLNDYLANHGVEVNVWNTMFDKYPIEIISGGARGTDMMGEKYASMHYIKCVRFPADWNKYGKAAGPIRNRQMAEYASSGGEDCQGVLFAFWDGVSRGTKNMIETAEKHGLEVHIIRYKKRDGECDLTGAALINGR